MKRTGIDHPKLRRLARKLGIPRYAAVGICESTWHFTAKHAIRGDLGKWSDEEIADAIDWPADDAGRLIDALVEAKLLDRHPVYRLVVHDWHVHADESVKKTVKKHGWECVSKVDHSGMIPERSGTSPETGQNECEQVATVPDSQSHSQSRSLAKPEPSHKWSSTSETTTGRDDHFDADFWERVRLRARNTGLRCRDPGDRSLVLKACTLVEAGRLPEDWLADAVEGLKQKAGDIQNRFAYLHATLENSAAEKYHVRLAPMLASIDVPEQLLTPAPKPAVADLEPVGAN